MSSSIQLLLNGKPTAYDAYNNDEVVVATPSCLAFFNTSKHNENSSCIPRHVIHYEQPQPITELRCHKIFGMSSLASLRSGVVSLWDPTHTLRPLLSFVQQNNAWVTDVQWVSCDASAPRLLGTCTVNGLVCIWDTRIGGGSDTSTASFSGGSFTNPSASPKCVQSLAVSSTGARCSSLQFNPAESHVFSVMHHNYITVHDIRMNYTSAGSGNNKGSSAMDTRALLAIEGPPQHPADTGAGCVGASVFCSTWGVGHGSGSGSTVTGAGNSSSNSVGTGGGPYLVVSTRAGAAVALGAELTVALGSAPMPSDKAADAASAPPPPVPAAAEVQWWNVKSGMMEALCDLPGKAPESISAGEGGMRAPTSSSYYAKSVQSLVALPHGTSVIVSMNCTYSHEQQVGVGAAGAGAGGNVSAVGSGAAEGGGAGVMSGSHSNSNSSSNSNSNSVPISRADSVSSIASHATDGSDGGGAGANNGVGAGGAAGAGTMNVVSDVVVDTYVSLINCSSSGDLQPKTNSSGSVVGRTSNNTSPHAFLRTYANSSSETVLLKLSQIFPGVQTSTKVATLEHSQPKEGNFSTPLHVASPIFPHHNLLLNNMHAMNRIGGSSTVAGGSVSGSALSPKGGRSGATQQNQLAIWSKTTSTTTSTLLEFKSLSRKGVLYSVKLSSERTTSTSSRGGVTTSGSAYVVDNRHKNEFPEGSNGRTSAVLAKNAAARPPRGDMAVPKGKGASTDSPLTPTGSATPENGKSCTLEPKFLINKLADGPGPGPGLGGGVGCSSTRATSVTSSALSTRVYQVSAAHLWNIIEEEVLLLETRLEDVEPVCKALASSISITDMRTGSSNSNSNNGGSAYATSNRTGFAVNRNSPFTPNIPVAEDAVPLHGLSVTALNAGTKMVALRMAVEGAAPGSGAVGVSASEDPVLLCGTSGDLSRLNNPLVAVFHVSLVIGFPAQFLQQAGVHPSFDVQYSNHVAERSESNLPATGAVAEAPGADTDTAPAAPPSLLDKLRKHRYEHGCEVIRRELHQLCDDIMAVGSNGAGSLSVFNNVQVGEMMHKLIGGMGRVFHDLCIKYWGRRDEAAKTAVSTVNAGQGLGTLGANVEEVKVDTDATDDAATTKDSAAAKKSSTGDGNEAKTSKKSKAKSPDDSESDSDSSEESDSLFSSSEDGEEDDDGDSESSESEEGGDSAGLKSSDSDEGSEERVGSGRDARRRRRLSNFASTGLQNPFSSMLFASNSMLNTAGAGTGNLGGGIGSGTQGTAGITGMVKITQASYTVCCPRTSGAVFSPSGGKLLCFGGATLVVPGAVGPSNTPSSAPNVQQSGTNTNTYVSGGKLASPGPSSKPSAGSAAAAVPTPPAPSTGGKNSQLASPPTAVLANYSLDDTSAGPVAHKSEVANDSTVGSGSDTNASSIAATRYRASSYGELAVDVPLRGGSIVTPLSSKLTVSTSAAPNSRKMLTSVDDMGTGSGIGGVNNRVLRFATHVTSSDGTSHSEKPNGDEAPLEHPKSYGALLSMIKQDLETSIKLQRHEELMQLKLFKLEQNKLQKGFRLQQQKAKEKKKTSKSSTSTTEGETSKEKSRQQASSPDDVSEGGSGGKDGSGTSKSKSKKNPGIGGSSKLRSSNMSSDSLVSIAEEEEEHELEEGREGSLKPSSSATSITNASSSAGIAAICEDGGEYDNSGAPADGDEERKSLKPFAKSTADLRLTIKNPNTVALSDSDGPGPYVSDSERNDDASGSDGGALGTRRRRTKKVSKSKQRSSGALLSLPSTSPGSAGEGSMSGFSSVGVFSSDNDYDTAHTTTNDEFDENEEEDDEDKGGSASDREEYIGVAGLLSTRANGFSHFSQPQMSHPGSTVPGIGVSAAGGALSGERFGKSSHLSLNTLNGMGYSLGAFYGGETTSDGNNNSKSAAVNVNIHSEGNKGALSNENSDNFRQSMPLLSKFLSTKPLQLTTYCANKEEALRVYLAHKYTLRPLSRIACQERMDDAEVERRNQAENRDGEQHSSMSSPQWSAYPNSPGEALNKAVGELTLPTYEYDVIDDSGPNGLISSVQATKFGAGLPAANDGLPQTSASGLPFAWLSQLDALVYPNSFDMVGLLNVHNDLNLPGGKAVATNAKPNHQETSASNAKPISKPVDEKALDHFLLSAVEVAQRRQQHQELSFLCGALARHNDSKLSFNALNGGPLEAPPDLMHYSQRVLETTLRAHPSSPECFYSGATPLKTSPLPASKNGEYVSPQLNPGSMMTRNTCLIASLLTNESSVIVNGRNRQLSSPGHLPQPQWNGNRHFPHKLEDVIDRDRSASNASGESMGFGYVEEPLSVGGNTRWNNAVNDFRTHHGQGSSWSFVRSPLFQQVSQQQGTGGQGRGFPWGASKHDGDSDGASTHAVSDAGSNAGAQISRAPSSSRGASPAPLISPTASVSLIDMARQSRGGSLTSPTHVATPSSNSNNAVFFSNPGVGPDIASAAAAATTLATASFPYLGPARSSFASDSGNISSGLSSPAAAQGRRRRAPLNISLLDPTPGSHSTAPDAGGPVFTHHQMHLQQLSAVGLGPATKTTKPPLFTASTSPIPRPVPAAVADRASQKPSSLRPNSLSPTPGASDGGDSNVGRSRNNSNAPLANGLMMRSVDSVNEFSENASAIQRSSSSGSGSLSESVMIRIRKQRIAAAESYRRWVERKSRVKIAAAHYAGKAAACRYNALVAKSVGHATLVNIWNMVAVSFDSLATCVSSIHCSDAMLGMGNGGSDAAVKAAKGASGTKGAKSSASGVKKSNNSTATHESANSCNGHSPAAEKLSGWFNAALGGRLLNKVLKYCSLTGDLQTYATILCLFGDTGSGLSGGELSSSHLGGLRCVMAPFGGPKSTVMDILRTNSAAKSSPISVSASTSPESMTSHSERKWTSMHCNAGLVDSVLTSYAELLYRWNLYIPATQVVNHTTTAHITAAVAVAHQGDQSVPTQKQQDPATDKPPVPVLNKELIDNPYSNPSAAAASVIASATSPTKVSNILQPMRAALPGSRSSCLPATNPAVTSPVAAIDNYALTEAASVIMSVSYNCELCGSGYPSAAAPSTAANESAIGPIASGRSKAPEAAPATIPMSNSLLSVDVPGVVSISQTEASTAVDMSSSPTTQSQAGAGMVPPTVEGLHCMNCHVSSTKSVSGISKLGRRSNPTTTATTITTTTTVIKRRKEPSSVRCILCQLPVKGQVSFCYQCGHGGHVEHMYEWFSQHEECPAGCGCVCGDVAVSRDGTDDFYFDDEGDEESGVNPYRHSYDMNYADDEDEDDDDDDDEEEGEEEDDGDSEASSASEEEEDDEDEDEDEEEEPSESEASVDEAAGAKSVSPAAENGPSEVSTDQNGRPSAGTSGGRHRTSSKTWGVHGAISTNTNSFADPNSPAVKKRRNSTSEKSRKVPGGRRSQHRRTIGGGGEDEEALLYQGGATK